MGKRGRLAQTRHDRKVEQRAEALKGQGYQVQADLPGQSRPPTIGGRIPDIFARRGRQLVVEEIETPGTLASDRRQQAELREATKELGGKFSVRIAKP